MITSPRNRRVVNAVRLKKRALREKDGRFLVEGVQGVLEALAFAGRVREVFHVALPDLLLAELARAASVAAARVTPVSEEVMAHLTSTVTPQGVVAVVDFVDDPLERAVRQPGIVPVLVEVRDPGNAGTILRSADASGAEAVVFTSSSVDVYNPKTVRASAGSLFHVPVVRGAALGPAVAALRERGFAVVAADANGSDSVYDLDLSAPTAVLLGNEAHGLPSDAVTMADRTVRVPIEGRAESLNLAAAATVILFEAARRRSGGDPLAHVVAGAAHDLRSPLTALRGFATTLVSRWERLDEEQRLLMLEGIEHDASRMDVIVTQLVDAARIASGHLRLAVEPIDLLDVVRRVAEDVSRWGTVSVEVSGGSLRASFDPARLRTILMAAVDAAQWWGEEGPVRIGVQGGADPGVEVSRNGTRLDAGAAAGLFLPRAPGTGGGSKVGLFVARALAERHGARLDGDTDGGIRFRLSVRPA